MKISLSLIVMAVALLVAVRSGYAADRVEYYHTDALGSVVVSTDEDGNVLWREGYKPFGSRIEKTVSTADNTPFYTGKSHDDATGLSYFGARYYDPNIGRFLGVDPVGVDPANLHSFNRYAYANNNPYVYVDPDGRDAIVAVEGNNVNINIPIRYTGAGADAATIRKFNSGIENEWSGKFGEFNVTTTVTNAETHGILNEITVPKGNGRANVVGGQTGTWPSERPAWTAAHEAGHLMGLDDRYDTKTNKPEKGWENNIMARHGKPADHRNISQIKESDRNKIIEK